MFVAFQRKTEDDILGHEVFFNTDFITKIEVRYVTGGNGETHWRQSLTEGRKDPSSIREYTVFVAGDKIRLVSNVVEHTNAFKAIEEICKGAVKD